MSINLCFSNSSIRARKDTDMSSVSFPQNAFSIDVVTPLRSAWKQRQIEYALACVLAEFRTGRNLAVSV